mgnify:CR=1 FL=1
MRMYVTGCANPQRLEELAFQLRELGHSTVLPYDVLDETYTEDQCLRERAKALLGCDVVVTTPPAFGAWSIAANSEVAIARAAHIDVHPSIRFLTNTTTT